MPDKKGSGDNPQEIEFGGSFSAANLQKEIDSAGASWKAASTRLALLSIEEQQARLGLVVNEEKLKATAIAIEASERVRAMSAEFAAAPGAVDWRNKGGNWITSIKDQGDCGSCVSFATLATLEARLNIVCNNAGLDMDLSEAHLFYCGCGACCGSGWEFEPALDFCKHNGVGLDSDFPYSPFDQPCPAGVPAAVRITNWTPVFSIADRKNIIATKGPMVGGMRLFGDFFAYSGGVYEHVLGLKRGQHAISVIGYNDAQGCWICKNSWGDQSWGEDGFFRIAYGQCGIDTEFPFYDMDVSCPDTEDGQNEELVDRDAAPVDCAQYIPVLKQALIAAQTNASLRRCLRYYVCGRGARPTCSASVTRVVNAVTGILEQCPELRTPFCQILQ